MEWPSGKVSTCPSQGTLIGLHIADPRTGQRRARHGGAEHFTFCVCTQLVVRALYWYECQSRDDVILVSNIICSAATISFLVQRHPILCSVSFFVQCTGQ